MSPGQALATLTANEPVYWWGDLRQKWSRVISIKFDAASRRYLITGRPLTGIVAVRNPEPLGRRDKLTANPPANLDRKFTVKSAAEPYQISKSRKFR